LLTAGERQQTKENRLKPKLFKQKIKGTRNAPYIAGGKMNRHNNFVPIPYFKTIFGRGRGRRRKLF
jgi:hypothetical protein